MGHCLQKAETQGVAWSSWSTVHVDVAASACSSSMAKEPDLCSLAHVSTVLVFFLIGKSGGPSSFSGCIMAALMSFIEALE